MHSPKVYILILFAYFTTGDEVTTTFQLPRHIYPVHYDLVIIPQISERTYSGTVDVILHTIENISRPINQIELNVNDLDIDSYEVRLKKGDKDMQIDLFYQQEEYEKLIIVIKENLENSTAYSLHLEFSGFFEESKKGGLLLRSYKDAKNNTREYIFGKMFPVYARQVFPCFDEPHFKATFNVTLGRPNEFSSITTMPISSTTPGLNSFGEKIMWDVFQETPEMSPSSLGILISQMTPIKNDTTNITIWAESLEEAQSISSMPHWEYLFELAKTITFSSYLLPNINFIFVPDLFEAAFESWGIIYIRSNNLAKMLDTESPEGSVVLNSISGSEALIVQISKQIATQYFGETVSPDSWWTDVWIREAISQYFGFFMASQFDRSWSFYEFMSGLLRNLVLEGEKENQNAYPLAAKNITNSSELINSLTHSRNLKGASFIFMLWKSLSHPIFSQALFKFLREHALGAGTTEELVFEWQNELDKYNVTYNYNFTLENILIPWFYETGVPVMSVMRREDPGNLTLMLSQVTYSNKELSGEFEEIVSYGESPQGYEETKFFKEFAEEYRYETESLRTFYNWYIPIVFTSASEMDFSYKRVETWFGPHMVKNNSRYTMTIRDAGMFDDWVLFDIGASGLYRINYDYKNWKLLAAQLKKNASEIPLMNRVQILDDVLNLAFCGQAQYFNALPIAEYLVNETSFYPWFSAYKAFKKLDTILVGNMTIYNPFKSYVTNLVIEIYTKILTTETQQYNTFSDQIYNGNSKEEYLNVLLTAETLRWACDYSISDCLDKASASLQAYLNGNLTVVREEYKDTVFCGGLVNADDNTWNAVYDLYKKTNSSTEAKIILPALACTKKTNLIDLLLKELIIKSFTPDEAVNAFHGICRRHDHTDKALDFLSSNATDISNVYGKETLVRFISTLGPYITTHDQAEKLSNITLENDTGNIQSAINSTLEHVQTTLNWLDTFNLPLYMYFYPTNTTQPPGGFTTLSPPTSNQPANGTVSPTTGSNAYVVTSSYTMIIVFFTFILSFK